MKTLRLCLATVLALSFSVLAVEETYRVITSSDGKDIKAWIRKVENDQVTFRRDDGKVFTIPLNRLSEEDQVALRKMQAAAPTAPAKPAAGADPKVNKRLYPRSLSEIVQAVKHIREVAAASKDFTDEERTALADLNIFRYLSGVPSEVPLDRKCCEIANKASEGCKKIGTLSHDAAPEGQSCNLHQGQADFSQMVAGYMEDPGDNNRDARGHRMWCLHPFLAKTGFGRDGTNEFYAMWVSEGGLANNGKSKSRQEFHAYPGNGFYPLSRLHGNGWSVYSGSALAPGEAEIKMYQLTARPEMPLNAANMPKDATEVKIGFQKRNGSEGGWTLGWEVFEPDVKPKVGDIYWISVKSKSVRFGYVVEFTGDDI